MPEAARRVLKRKPGHPARNGCVRRAAALEKSLCYHMQAIYLTEQSFIACRALFQMGPEAFTRFSAFSYS